MFNVKVRPREYSAEEVGTMMKDQELANNPDIMRILEEMHLHHA